MPARADIDQLIEEGLARYGRGDLDGALEAWEGALERDPHNAQATSYVEYVRNNYDALVAGPEESAGDLGPFVVGDEEDYRVEVSPGEISAATARPALSDPLDEGWFLEDEGPPAAPEEQAIEMEAGEPPGLTFEDTREYYGGRPATRDLSLSKELLVDPVADALDATTNPRARRITPPTEFPTREVTPAFVDIDTPSGFGTQITDVRRRDLGFVKATDPAKQTKSGLPDPPPPAPRAKRATNVPELKLTLRTPEPLSDPLDTADITLDRGLPGPAPTIDFDTEETMARPAGNDDEFGSDLTRDVPAPHKSTRELDLPQRRPASATTPPASRPDIFVTNQPTLDLGLRPAGLPPRPATIDEDAPTTTRGGQLDIEGDDILDEVDRDAPADETRDDRTRRRIQGLLEHAQQSTRTGDLERAVRAAELALEEDATSALAQKLVHRNRDALMGVFQAFLGDLQRLPSLARPLHELGDAGINPRAAFLMSRVDGVLSLDEILDVSGMPRLEAYRYLCQLYLRGILR